MEIQFGLTVRFYYDKERTHFQKCLFSNSIAKKEYMSENLMQYLMLASYIELTSISLGLAR